MVASIVVLYFSVKVLTVSILTTYIYNMINIWE